MNENEGNELYPVSGSSKNNNSNKNKDGHLLINRLQNNQITNDLNINETQTNDNNINNDMMINDFLDGDVLFNEFIKLEDSKDKQNKLNGHENDNDNDDDEEMFQTPDQMLPFTPDNMINNFDNQSISYKQNEQKLFEDFLKQNNSNNNNNNNNNTNGDFNMMNNQTLNTPQNNITPSKNQNNEMNLYSNLDLNLLLDSSNNIYNASPSTANTINNQLISTTPQTSINQISSNSTNADNNDTKIDIYKEQCSELIKSLQFGRTTELEQQTYFNDSTTTNTNNGNSDDSLNYQNIDSQDLPYKLELSQLPEKSRVETQVKIAFKISPSPPVNIIHISNNCITKQKHFLKHDITTYTEQLQKQILYLDAQVICSTTNKSASVCARCLKREQRRSSRRKSGTSDINLWCNNENRKIVVFSSKQLTLLHNPMHSNFNSTKTTTNEFIQKSDDKNFKYFDLSSRLVCYCRHHKEPVGFKIIFVLKNHLGQIVAKSVSSVIKLIDKEPKKRNAANGNVSESSSLSATSDGNSSITTDRQSSFDISSVSASELDQLSETGNNNMAAMRFDTTTADLLQQNSPLPNGGSGLNLVGMNVPITSPALNHSSLNNGFINSIPGGVFVKSEKATLNTESLGSGSIPQRNQSISSANSMVRESHYQQMQTMPSFQTDLANTAEPLPAIQRIIPAQGPITGGVEVTILGTNFKPGMCVKFGQNRALSANCWSNNTIIAYSPPAPSAGQVVVTIFNEQDEQLSDQLATSNPNPNAIFTYVDETDRQLIELALQIVGLKMNGKVEDARNIAKRIVSDTSGSESSPATNNNNSNSASPYIQYQSLVARVIKLINNSSTNLSLCNKDGQTLLHLACLKGYIELIIVLIKRGARVEIGDKYGFTPLHFACLNGDFRSLKILMTCKADPSCPTSTRELLTPLEVFTANHSCGSKADYEECFAVLNTSMERKNSLSSINSDILDNDSIYSNGSGFQVHISRMMNDQISDDEDESNAESESAYEEGSAYDEDIYSGDEEENAPGEAHADEQRKTAESSSTEDQQSSKSSESLPPQYDDLFPHAEKTFFDQEPHNFSILSSQKHKRSVTTETANRQLLLSAPITPVMSEMEDGTDTEDIMQLALSRNISSDDTEEKSDAMEDANDAYENTVFKQKQDFFKDKMLLFFWIPFMLIMVSSFLIFSFGATDNKVHHFSERSSASVRYWLTKIVLGNKRVQTVFKDALQHGENAFKEAFHSKGEMIKEVFQQAVKETVETALS